MNHPFKELDFFAEDDRENYAGREQDIRALSARVLSSRTTVLYGRSGLGKTSLLRAGLFPQLEEQGFRCVYVRILDSPLKDLAATLAAQFTPKLPTAAIDTFTVADEHAGTLVREACERLSGADVPPDKRRTLLVVFDQFEEFFTIFHDQPLKRYAFVREIAALVRGGAHGVRIIFSLREDYLYALDDFQRQLPDLFSSAYRLLPLSAFGARAAIVRPLENRTIPYDDALVTALLDALARDEFESAHLQLAAVELFGRTPVGQADGSKGGNGKLRFELGKTELEEVRAQGGDGLFQRYLTRALAQVPIELQMDARTLLDLLITEGETKLALAEDQLLDSKIAAPDRMKTVLEELAKSRLIRRSEHPGGCYYELRHECLISTIRVWQKEHRPFADFLDARAAISNNGRNAEFKDRPARLLSEDILRQGVMPNVERLKLSAQETEFVLWSAIRRRIPEWVEWKKRWEAATQRPVTEVLAQMLDHTSPSIRGSAAAAIAELVPEDDQLVARCVKLMGEGGGTETAEMVVQPAIESVGTIARRRGDLRLFADCLKVAEDSLQRPAIRVRAFKCAVSPLVADGDPTAIKSWLRLALEGAANPELAELQREASVGLARYATPQQVRDLRFRISWWRTKPRELVLLADFYEAHRVALPRGDGPSVTTRGPGRIPSRGYSGLGWWLRRKAQRAWEQRALGESSARLTTARQAGFLNGAMLGVCWIAMIFLPTVFMLAPILQPTDPREFLLVWLLFLSPCGGCVAWLSGWRAAVCAVNAEIIVGDASSSASVRRSAWLFWAGFIVLVPVWISLLFSIAALLKTSEYASWIFYLLGFGLGYAFGISFRWCFARLISVLDCVLEKIIRGTTDKRVKCLWIGLATLALLVATPLLASSFVPSVCPLDWVPHIYSYGVWFFCFNSALSFGWVGGLALRAEDAQPSSAMIPTDSFERWPRLAIIGIVLLLIPWFIFWRHGGDGFPIPGLWKTFYVDRSAIFEARLRLWPDVAAFEVKTVEPLITAAFEGNSQNVRSYIDSGPGSPSIWNGAELLLWLPNRLARFIIYDSFNVARAAPVTNTFHFRPERFRESSEKAVFKLDSERPLPVWIDFKPDAAQGAWTGAIAINKPDVSNAGPDAKKEESNELACALIIQKNVFWTKAPLKNDVSVSVYDRATEAEGIDPLLVDRQKIVVQPTLIRLEASKGDAASAAQVKFVDGQARINFELSGLPTTAAETPRLLVLFLATAKKNLQKMNSAPPTTPQPTH